METVQRFDIAEIKKASRTAQGFLKAPVRATRTGIFIYKDAKGKEFKELRLPEEVYAEPSMESLVMIPITNNHPYEFVDSFNAKTHMVGFTGEKVYKDEDTFLSTTAIITDERTIKEVENREKEQVSLGYKAALEMKKGFWNGKAIAENGTDDERFDAIQRDIRYNHLAVVPAGRAGMDVKLRLDGKNNLVPQIDREDPKMKVKIGDKEFEVEQDLGDAIKSVMKSKDAAEGKLAKQKTDGEEADAVKIDALAKENETLKGKNDALEADLKKVNDPREFSTKVQARAKLLDTAKAVLDEKEHEKLDSMADMEIKKAVILADDAEVKLDEKSEDYVNGRFEHLAKDKAEKKDGDDLGEDILGARNDKADGKDEDKEAKRKDDITTAWKKPL